MWHICTVEHCSTIRSSKTLSFDPKQMNIEDLTLGRASQALKDRHRMYPLKITDKITERQHFMAEAKRLEDTVARVVSVDSRDCTGTGGPWEVGSRKTRLTDTGMEVYSWRMI